MNKNIFFDLLIYKTRANLRAEVARLYLAYVWWVLNPLFNMAIFYVVFGIFMNSRQEHFALFLLLGTSQWQWFASTVQHAAGSIWGAGNTMRQINIPKIFFPLEVFLQDSFKHLFVLMLLAIFLAVYPVPARMCWIAAPLIIVIQGVFVMGFSILSAGIVPFLPDFRFVLQTFIHGLFFLTGIFFKIETFILPEHRPYLYLNPMAGFIRELRRIFIDGQWPDWIYLMNTTVASCLLLAFAVVFVRKFDSLYPRLCQE